MYFYQTTHLKRQIDVLRDKMGMDVAPNPINNLLNDYVICFCSLRKQKVKMFLVGI